MRNAPHLDVVSYAPFLDRDAARALFRFLRSQLPYYRVKYSIRRGGSEMQINTPRWTSVFGVDETARFVPDPSSSSSSSSSLEAQDQREPSSLPPSPSPPTEREEQTHQQHQQSPLLLVDAKTGRPVPVAAAYPTCRPRPVPGCLDGLRRLVEAFTGEAYNFVLVNYYAGGADSISWHSDDERFLGPHPAIASLSLGATRDFLLRHKPLARDARKDHTGGIGGNRGTFGKRGAGAGGRGGGRGGVMGGGGRGGGGLNGEKSNDPPDEGKLTEEEQRVREAHADPIKFAMATGDMVLMRGETQSHWLHSVPKRSAKSAGGGEGGRINITFRKALVKGGTENYYQYNVGRGPTMVWDEARKEMVEWQAPPEDASAAGKAFTFEKNGTDRDVNGADGWTRGSSKYGINFERSFQDR